MGISQAVFGIYQTAANALVIQHCWSLNGGVPERISGHQKFKECRNVWGATWSRIRYAEVKTYWSAPVSYSDHSYVSHLAQAVPLIIKGRKHKTATPTGTAHLKQNTTNCCHTALDNIDCLVMTERKILFLGCSVLERVEKLPYSTLLSVKGTKMLSLNNISTFVVMNIDFLWFLFHLNIIASRQE